MLPHLYLSKLAKMYDSFMDYICHKRFKLIIKYFVYDEKQLYKCITVDIRLQTSQCTYNNICKYLYTHRLSHKASHTNSFELNFAQQLLIILSLLPIYFI